MVVEGSHQEDAPSLSVFAFGVFEPALLQQHAHAFHKEDAAQQRQEEFLADKNRGHSDHAAYGKGAGVAHKHLRGEGVVPQEAYQGASESSHINRHLSAAWQVHYVEVTGVDYVAAEVGEDAESYAHYGRSAGCQAVQAVREVGSVGTGQDDDYYHHDVNAPGEVHASLSLERGKPGVIELVGLYEGDGGDELFGTVSPDLGGEAEDEGYAQGKDELEYEFHLRAEAVLVMLEHLYIIVREAYAAAPYGGEEQKLHVDVAQVADKQGAHKQRSYDYDSAHSGGALLLHLAFQTQVAYGFAYLGFLEPAYDGAPGEECEEHADNHGGDGPERQVGHQAVSREVVILKKIEKMV